MNHPFFDFHVFLDDKLEIINFFDYIRGFFLEVEYTKFRLIHFKIIFNFFETLFDFKVFFNIRNNIIPNSFQILFFFGFLFILPRISLMSISILKHWAMKCSFFFCLSIKRFWKSGKVKQLSLFWSKKLKLLHFGLRLVLKTLINQVFLLLSLEFMF